MRTTDDIKREIEFVKEDIRELGKIRAYTDAAERDLDDLEKELAEVERSMEKGSDEMTLEEAIKAMQNIDLVLSVTESEHEAARMAISALRAQQERENPQPLTLEEVKEHIKKGHPNDIKPLYVDFKPTIPIDYTSRWRDAYNLSRLIAGRGDEYGKTWIAYRSKPKEGNR